MPTLETLTEDDLRKVMRSKSLRRARGYVDRVRNPVRAGQTLTAQVRGSRLYEVEIDVEPTGISARCSCPYNWGGYCKHIGAVLLKWMQSPGSFAAGDVPPTRNEYPIEVTPVEPLPTHRPEELPSWLTAPFTERQHADDQQLWEWLSALKLPDLRQMAKQRGWKVKGTRKADVVRQIAERITDPGEVLRAVLKLDEEHRHVLRALVLLGEKENVWPDEVKRVASTWGELKSHENAFTYTRHLWKMGLALPGAGEDSYPPRSDFVPPPILRSLPPVLEDVIQATLHPQSNIGELRLTDPRPFVRAVNQIMLLLEQSPTPLRPPMPRPRLERFYAGLEDWDYDPAELLRAKSAGTLHSHFKLHLTVPPPAHPLPDEAIERLAPVAGGEVRLEFIYSLLVAAGLLQPGSPVTVWPEVKEQFLRQSELTQRAILARVYFEMHNWSVLWALLRVDGGLQLKRAFDRYYKPERLHTDLARFRRLTLRVLASLPDDRWVTWPDLLRLTRVVWPRFDQTVWQIHWRPSTTAGWFLVSTRKGKPLDPADADNWELAQGAFIRQVITGPLHWLGLADLGFADGQVAAVRFHGLADLYWDRVEAPDAPPVAATQTSAMPSVEAVTTDRHTISVAPAAIQAEAHSLLSKIARLEVATAERFVYRLDTQVAYASFEGGASLSEMLHDWERLLPIPLPDAIRDQLTAWWDAYGQVRIYENLTIIEFGDDYALAEMKAVTPLEQVLIAELSPRLVIIPHEAVDALTEALERAGHTPKRTDEV